MKFFDVPSTSAQLLLQKLYGFGVRWNLSARGLATHATSRSDFTGAMIVGSRMSEWLMRPHHWRSASARIKRNRKIARPSPSHLRSEQRPARTRPASMRGRSSIRYARRGIASPVIVAFYVVFPGWRWRRTKRRPPLRDQHALKSLSRLLRSSSASCRVISRCPGAKRRVRSARTTETSPSPARHPKKAQAHTAPKIISSKVRATPICNH